MSDVPRSWRGTARPTPGAVGRWLVAGLVALGVAAAAVGIGWQRGQTRSCLAFFGPEAARTITRAPHVELWSGVRCDPGARSLVAERRLDISAARGLVHLRRGLVEDANYGRGPERHEGGAAKPADGWAHVLVFSRTAVDRVAGDGEAVAVCLDGGADASGTPRRLTVVGRPGILQVGRIGPGLRAWIDATLAAESR